MNENDWQNFLHCGSIMQIDPDRYLIGCGIRTWYPTFSNKEVPHFYFPDFFLIHPSPWFQHEKTAILKGPELLHQLPDQKPLKQIAWTNPHYPLFAKTFEELQSLFSQGLLKKAVPYVFEENRSIHPKQLICVLKKILLYTRQQPLHVYGFWDERQGMLGASPEILFKYKGIDSKKIETCALAGTKNQTLTNESFLADPKELLEHQVVVEGICESLKPLGVVKTGKLDILKLPRLSHLITPIEVETTDNVEYSSLVKALHPTPALGAFPKFAGMKWLQTYQKKMARQRYGAPVGCILEKGSQAHCIVAIRNIQWDRNGAKIGAGCGVIAESCLEKEWQEICLKISSIKDMMDL